MNRLIPREGGGGGWWKMIENILDAKDERQSGIEWEDCENEWSFRYSDYWIVEIHLIFELDIDRLHDEWMH